MPSRHDQPPKAVRKQPMQDPVVDDLSAGGIFRAKGQGEGLEVVRPEDLARAKTTVADGDAAAVTTEPTAEPAKPETQDMTTFGDKFPEIKGFDQASGTLHFQEGPLMKMNHLPGLPPCDVKIVAEDARHVELRISYGERYSLLLSRRTTDGKIDFDADTGRGVRRLTSKQGNTLDLRASIEEFKVRSYEHFMEPRKAAVNPINYTPTPKEEPPQPISKQPSLSPFAKLRKLIGL